MDATAPTKRAPLIPFSVTILRWIALFYLALFKRFRTVNVDFVPAIGPLILVGNHTTALDPVCLQSACNRRLIRFMQAREFYNKRPMYYLYRILRVIPVNRNGNDTTSFRTALRALGENACIGIYPEGQISDGSLRTARQGVALLALLSNATIVPVYLQGSRPFAGMIRDFLRFDRITLYFGAPILLDDLTKHHGEAGIREAALKRIVDAIVTLREHSVSGEAE